MKRFLFGLLLLPFITLAQAPTKEVETLIQNYQFANALKILQNNYDTLNEKMQQQAGYCHFKLGNFKLAITCYEGALKIDSTDRTTLNQLAQLYSRNNDYAKTLGTYFTLISQDSLNAFYYKQFAFYAAEIGELELAHNYYQKALKINPTDMEARLDYGGILLEVEKFNSLDSIINGGLAFESENKSLLLLKAKSNYQQKKYKETIKTIDKLLVFGDTTLAYARLLGISYFQLKDYKNVIPCMDFIVRTDLKPQDWVYYYLGMCYQHLNELPKSIEYLNTAIEKGISENISVYYTQLGTSYEAHNEPKNAIRAYKAAYESSKSGILLYHLARNYDQFYKDKSQAVSYYRRYLNSDDTIKVTREYSQKRLDSLEEKKN